MYLPYLVSMATGSNIVRIRMDGSGDGHFGARRTRNDGKVYPHGGIDEKCEPGQPIYAPCDSVYERIAYPYSGNRKYTGGVFRSEKVIVKCFYFSPETKAGELVKKGDIVGIAQDISVRYNTPDTPHEKRMTPHIHTEIMWCHDDLIKELKERYGINVVGKVNPYFLI